MSEDEEFAAKVQSLLDENDQTAAQVCRNFQALGVQGYFVREVDGSIEREVTDVRIIGPIHAGSGDMFRRGASLCERYLRDRAKAN